MCVSPVFLFQCCTVMEGLAHRILGDFPIRFTLQEQLLHLQGIQFARIGIAGQNHHVRDLTSFQAATGKHCGQFIAHIEESAAVFCQVFINMVFCITGQNVAFVNFYGQYLTFAG